MIQINPEAVPTDAEYRAMLVKRLREFANELETGSAIVTMIQAQPFPHEGKVLNGVSAYHETKGNLHLEYPTDLLWGKKQDDRNS